MTLGVKRDGLFTSGRKGGPLSKRRKSSMWPHRVLSKLAKRRLEREREKKRERISLGADARGHEKYYEGEKQD